MNDPEKFEAAEGDELPPDGWLLHKCEKLFPYLKPNSGVGGLSLELTVDFANAKLARRIRQLQAENGLPYSEGEVEELAEAFYAARASWGIAYDDFHFYIQSALSNKETPISYDQAVMDAAAQSFQSINNNPVYTPPEKKALIELSDRLAVYYRLETDCHFLSLLEPPNQSS